MLLDLQGVYMVTVIKGESGYCCSDEVFNDKVIIMPIEIEINSKRK